MLPKKHTNLRSVGSYQHSVRELFERCLDLYLCPRVMKRRLNIDPESLIPSLPNAQDLRPFPSIKCIEYEIPNIKVDNSSMIRCISISPDGQFLVSGTTNAHVRIWEVQTGRLLRTWDMSALVSGNADNDIVIKKTGCINVDKVDNKELVHHTPTKSVISIEWNPKKFYHCLLVAIDKCAVIIATGTGDTHASNLTKGLFAASSSFANVNNIPDNKNIQWESLMCSKKMCKFKRK